MHLFARYIPTAETNLIKSVLRMAALHGRSAPSVFLEMMRSMDRQTECAFQLSCLLFYDENLIWLLFAFRDSELERTG